MPIHGTTPTCGRDAWGATYPWEDKAGTGEGPSSLNEQQLASRRAEFQLTF